MVKCTLYACVCKYHNYCPNEIVDSLKGNGGKFVVCDSLHGFLYRNVSSNPWTVFYVSTDTLTNAKIVCEYLRMIPFSVLWLSDNLEITVRDGKMKIQENNSVGVCEGGLQLWCLIRVRLCEEPRLGLTCYKKIFKKRKVLPCFLMFYTFFLAKTCMFSCLLHHRLSDSSRP